MGDEENPSLVAPPQNEVTVKCTNLTDEERKELKDFLASQSTVKEVRQRFNFQDAITTHQIPPDLIVVLGDLAKAAIGTAVTTMIKNYLSKSKSRKQQEEGTTERVALYDDATRVVKFVTREKR